MGLFDYFSFQAGRHSAQHGAAQAGAAAREAEDAARAAKRRAQELASDVASLNDRAKYDHEVMMALALQRNAAKKTIEELRQENEALRKENRDLQIWLSGQSAVRQRLLDALHEIAPGHPLASPFEAGTNPLREEIAQEAEAKKTAELDAEAHT